MAETRAQSLLELSKHMEEMRVNQTKESEQALKFRTQINDKVATICNILAELCPPPPDPMKRPMEHVSSSSAVFTPYPSPTQPSPTLNQLSPPCPETPDAMNQGQKRNTFNPAGLTAAVPQFWFDWGVDKEPETILDKKVVNRHNAAITKILVKWKGLPPYKATWEFYQDFTARYPNFTDP